MHVLEPAARKITGSNDETFLVHGNGLIETA
jgi:hypothetical protein